MWCPCPICPGHRRPSCHWQAQQLVATKAIGRAGRACRAATLAARHLRHTWRGRQSLQRTAGKLGKLEASSVSSRPVFIIAMSTRTIAYQRGLGTCSIDADVADKKQEKTLLCVTACLTQLDVPVWIGCNWVNALGSDSKSGQFNFSSTLPAVLNTFHIKSFAIKSQVQLKQRGCGFEQTGVRIWVTGCLYIHIYCVWCNYMIHILCIYDVYDMYIHVNACDL